MFVWFLWLLCENHVDLIEAGTPEESAEEPVEGVLNIYSMTGWLAERLKARPLNAGATAGR